MTKVQCINRLESLFYQEFKTTKQPTENLINRNLSKDFCGVVFSDDFAYACNEHIIARISCVDCPREHTLFYNFILDEVFSEDPFSQKINLNSLKAPFLSWTPDVLKIRKEDLYESVRKNASAIKNRRDTYIRITFNPGDSHIKLVFYNPLIDIEVQSVSPWKINPQNTGTINFMVNANYLYKALEIFTEYHVIDICIDNESNYVLLKGVNKEQSKPDIRIAIGFSKDFLN
jgi:hypothetical protein